MSSAENRTGGIEGSSNEANHVAQTEDDFLQGKTIDEYSKHVMGIIKQCQRYSTELQGWQNYADYSAVNKSMLSVTNQLHNLISKIFIHQDIKLSIKGYKLEDQYEIIKEGNDALTERISSAIDEACGLNRNNDASEIVDTTIRTIRGPVNEENGREIVLHASRNVQKPQMFFIPKINNSAMDPFIPLIKEKPNSIKPLSIMLCVDSNGREYFSHPYHYELEHWDPPEELLKKHDPVKPLPISKTPLLLVANEENLKIIVDELKQEREIGVDLEHHSFRTYQGLTCLIQISSRKKDYIIDPFRVRNQLPLLNEVFTDPKITKVFHGADKDIIWLQRDCGVYVVNMFDTHQAATVLEYPLKSLSYLLSVFCSINANKTYQRADWRIRPLPEDFIDYARHDTHYLLYIYDMMKNELIENGNELNNLLRATFSRSTELCMLRYEKPYVGPDSHMELYRRSRKLFNSRQLYALQQIYLWRDKLARQHDESVDYILPNHMMLQIAEVLPKEIQGILACCNPIPTYVKTEQLTLHHIIRAAKNLPLEEICMVTEQEKNDCIHQYPNSDDLMVSLDCRFDLSHVENESKGLSTLMEPQETMFGDLFSQNNFSDILEEGSEFWKLEPSFKAMRMRLKKEATEYMSPFERYSVSWEHFKLEEQRKAEEKLQKQNEKEEQNVKRIENIKEHFMALSGENSENSKKVKNQTKKASKEPENGDVNDGNTAGTSDKERMERLQNHIASLTSSLRETVSKMSNTPQEKIFWKTEKLNKRLRRLKNAKEKEENSSNPLKRRSSEIDASDDGIKKQKVEDEEKEESIAVKDEEEEEGMVEDEANEGGNEKEAFKPFDYSKANLNIFKSKKKKKFRGRRIEQKFKNNKNISGAFPQNSSKSISWKNDIK
ncbi:Exosome component 10 [Armadillidium nasatum]|uniref:Exosome complex component 10 homolog n=1 Tax=Armadillidium nasatum TaxID=96803 RepID=A0A5N5SKP1_9CRUS|nr:Exosome component 10 [Armadillidium nasatum]